MARIVHFDKRVGITYVYESTSYYDKEKRQSRSHRKLIGKIDPNTGEMIPTGKKGRPRKNTTPESCIPDYEALYEQVQKTLAKRDEQIAQLQNDLQRVNEECSHLRRIIGNIINLCQNT